MYSSVASKNIWIKIPAVANVATQIQQIRLTYTQSALGDNALLKRVGGASASEGANQILRSNKYMTGVRDNHKKYILIV